MVPILRLPFLEWFCNFRQFGFKKDDGYFFRFHWSSGPMCQSNYIFSTINCSATQVFHLITSNSMQVPDVRRNNFPTGVLERDAAPWQAEL